MSATTIVEVVRAHARIQPEALALGFLSDGEQIGPRLSYSALDEQARIIGATLQQLTKPGDRALLLYAPGLEFVAAFLGCQYAQVIAVPALPPNMNRLQSTVERFGRLIDDAEPALVLTTSELLPQLRSATRSLPEYAQVRWQASDKLDPRRAALWRPSTPAPDQLSFLQYTSGSTSAPKGVMVSHANLVANLEMAHESVGLSEPYGIVGWLPLFHDMGLIGNMLHGLYMGTQTHLMSPLSFLKRPLRWLQAIAAHGTVFSGGPNFAFEACLKRVKEADKEGLDLSGWRSAFCGAETVRSGTMERFFAAFASCGLRADALQPSYGLAEATLVVTAKTAGTVYAQRELDQGALETGRASPASAQEPSLNVVSCGTTKGSQEIAIVDPETRVRRAIGEVGEIWLRGPNIAQGYWRKPTLTEEAFAATITGEQEGAPYMRTGDLGFMIEDELFVTGRRKEIILVRGRCLYPQDLELMVESMADRFPELLDNESVVCAMEGATRERIGLIARINRRKNQSYDPDALVAAIQAQALASFEVGFDEIVLVRSATPKTSSGKKMRSACRRMLAEGVEQSLEVFHHFRRPGGAGADEQTPAIVPEAQVPTPGGPGEQELARIIVEWIAEENQLDPKALSTTQPLTDFALDSLAAVSLLEHLEQRLETSLSSSVLEQAKNIDELSHLVHARAS